MSTSPVLGGTPLGRGFATVTASRFFALALLEAVAEGGGAALVAEASGGADIAGALVGGAGASVGRAPAVACVVGEAVVAAESGGCSAGRNAK
jgi:hypothetical protein